MYTISLLLPYMADARITCAILYSYFMPVCSIVKTITPKCHGRPDALLYSVHEAEGRVQ